MTTIAYRNGVMAGDGRETQIAEGESALIIRDTDRKVFRLKDGRLFGAAKTSEDILRLYNSLKNGTPLPKLEDVNAILVDLKRRIWFNEGRIWQRGPYKFFAIGSGAGFAIAAMHAGATAIKAVRIAIKCDPYSGGRVSHVRLRQ